MTELKDVIYTASAVVEGGREGRGQTGDGLLDLNFAIPKEMGGSGNGTNPEQLFALGYAACFESALRGVAAQQGKRLTQVKVHSQVGIGPLVGVDFGFGLKVKLAVEIPELPPEQAQEILQAAHLACPYSNATRGNIEVELELI